MKVSACNFIEKNYAITNNFFEIEVQVLHLI